MNEDEEGIERKEFSVFDTYRSLKIARFLTHFGLFLCKTYQVSVKLQLKRNLCYCYEFHINSTVYNIGNLLVGSYVWFVKKRGRLTC